MKKIGLACTGGGTKALSNLGVIKALEELNIKISAISGTSIFYRLFYWSIHIAFFIFNLS